MRKTVVRTVLFLLPLLLAAWVLGLAFAPKDNLRTAGMQETDPLPVLSQPENSLDAVFLGDSEAYSGFVPMELWKDTGIASFVCASVDQKPYETEAFLREALKRQCPKVVVLETNVLYRAYSTQDLLVPKLQTLFPVLRYHSNWKTYSVPELFSAPDYRGDYPDRGYHLLTRADPLDDLTGYMAPTEAREELTKRNLRSLETMAALCKESGAELVLFSIPSPENWSMARHNTMADLAESLGCTYLDGNLLPLAIDWQTDTYDRGDHLNYYGAAKVTAWLGDWLTEHTALPDHRQDPAYEAWNLDAESFPQRLEAKLAEG